MFRPGRRWPDRRPIFSHYCNIVAAGFLRHGTCSCCPHGGEADMGHNGLMEDNGLGEFLAEFRAMLPAKSGTAQAIDRNTPLAQIAFRAIDDGFIAFPRPFSTFLWAC